MMNHEDKSKKQLVKDLSETPLNISNLKDTEEKFAKAFLENSISMGITALSDGRFIDVSNAFLKLMGCNRDEIVGHTSVETGFISPEDRVLFFQEMDKKGRIENYEMNFRMKGGVLRHGLFNAVKISLGNEMYLLTVMADITERKKAEKELKISEENYRSLFDNSPIGLYQVDPQSGRFIRANNVAARILGYESPEELMSSVTDITSQVYVNPEDREKALGWLKKDGFFNDFELQNRRKDGSIVWVLASVKIVRDDEGNILYHEGTSQDITAIRQAQKALSLSEVRYRQLYESMMDGFVSGDLRGYGIEANDAFLNMLGYSREELHRLNYKKITPKKWHAVDKIIMKEQLLTRGYSDIFEKEYIRKDGTIFPVELRTTLLRDENGNSIGFWAIVRDITKRKKIEEVLRVNEQKYRDIFNRSADGIYQLSPEGRIIDVNPAVARILGYGSPKELMNVIKDIGSQVYVDPGDREKIGRLLKKDAFFNDLELQNRRKDGSIVWILTSAHAVRDDQGNILYYEGTSKDITEMKRIQEALRLSEIKYRQLHESIMDGFVSVNMEGHILEFNESYEKMLGYSADELSRLTYKELTPEKWYAMEDAIVENQILSKGYSTVYEKEYIRKDGTVFPVELRTTMLKDASGKPIYMWAIVRDITERKQREEAIKKSEEKYRVITENIIDCIALVDKGGFIQYVSNSVEVVGYEPEELMNINALSRTHPDDLERVRRIYIDSINRGWREIIYETRIRHKNGEYLPIEIRERVLKDLHENFIGSVCVVRKITQRQQQEQSLSSLDQNYVDSRLTTRENEILGWVMKGKSTWDIAKILAISESTVKFHVDNIMKKFQAVNRAHAVAIALQRQQIGFD